MSKMIQGAAMIGGAVVTGAAMFALASTGVGFAALPYLASLMGSLALGGISMEAGAIAEALSSNRGTGITIRQPAAYRQLVYGIRRVGGVLVYASTTGSHHDQYNAVIVLAGHEVDAIENMYIDGRQVYWQGSGDGWSVRNGTGFGGVADSADHIGPGGQTYNFGGTGHSGIYVEARYGDQLPGDVIGALTANDPNWAADGSGNSPWLGGCTYVYVKLEYNESLFPGGPASAELRFTMRGKNNLYDPRTGTYGYSANWALIINDILTDTAFGLGDLGSVNQDQLIAAANVCDESVPLANGNTELRYQAHWNYDTSVSPGDALQNLMNAAGGRLSRVGGEWFIYPAYWIGPSFAFDASVLTGDLEWEPYRGLREICNRVNGTYIAPNVPYNDAGNLFDSNGWYNGTILNNWPFGFQPTSVPQYAMDSLHGYSGDAFLEADSGVQGSWASGTTYAQGDVIVYSGVIYRSLIDGNVGNQPDTHSLSGGSAATWASGTTYAAGQGAVYLGQLYVSLVAGNVGHEPDTSPSQWAAVTWVAWSNLLPMELDLNCVLSVAQAQRVYKIALLRNRQQGSGKFPMHLTAWRMAPLTVFTMTFPEMGWDAKVLEIASTRLYFEQQDSALAIRFEAQVQETAASTYEWSTAEELSVYDVPANPTNMPWNIASPSGLALTSSSSTAVIGADGVNHPRILASWTAPTDVRITQVQIQYQKVGDASWTDAGTVDSATTSAYISGVVSGSQYNVQIRSLTLNGATSGWSQAGPVTAAAPASLKSSYAMASPFVLTQASTTSIALAASSVSFGGMTAVSYAARTFTIPTPTVPTWYYVTVADATQQGETGATLTATCQTSNALVGAQGNTYLGAIEVTPSGSGAVNLAGGWPAPATYLNLP